MDDALRGRLTATVGTAGIDGDGVVQPADLTQLREVLALCETAGATVAPRGCARAASADVVVGADHLDAILVDPASLLIHVGAAAGWTAVRDAAAGRRLAVSGLPMVRSARAGESVALGEIAHRTLAGVDLLTVSGSLVSAGGRTLKDVVGYDIAGLALGSGDRLGLIVALSLRLEPEGARTPAEPGSGPWRGDAGADVVAAFG